MYRHPESLSSSLFGKRIEIEATIKIFKLNHRLCRTLSTGYCPIGSALYEKTYEIPIITKTFYPEIGGGESQARNLSVALASKGHQVTLVTPRSRGFLPRREEI